MVLNKSSKAVWQYQNVVGIAQITAVNSPSFEFGQYNDQCGKWMIPHTVNPTESYWVYNSGTPTLIEAERKFPTWKHVFLPVTAQVYAWLQGLPVDTNPVETDVIGITTLLSGMTAPLTVRVEEKEGTHPDVTQAVDCYCIGITSTAERGKEFLVEAEFAYGALEDIDPGGDNRPILTTAPLAAGLMTGTYNGNPVLEWNSVSIPGVEKAVWMEKKGSGIVSSDEGDKITIHTYKSEPVQIVLWGGIEVDDMWDDYKARTKRNMTIDLTKFDDVSYIKATFTNCRITSYERVGERYKGKYASIIKLEAEKVTYVNDFFTEGGTDFDTHWKDETWDD